MLSLSSVLHEEKSCMKETVSSISKEAILNPNKNMLNDNYSISSSANSKVQKSRAYSIESMMNINEIALESRNLSYEVFNSSDRMVQPSNNISNHLQLIDEKKDEKSNGRHAIEDNIAIMSGVASRSSSCRELSMKSFLSNSESASLDESKVNVAQHNDFKARSIRYKNLLFEIRKRSSTDQVLVIDKCVREVFGLIASSVAFLRKPEIYSLLKRIVLLFKSFPELLRQVDSLLPHPWSLRPVLDQVRKEMKYGFSESNPRKYETSSIYGSSINRYSDKRPGSSMNYESTNIRDVNMALSPNHKVANYS